MDSKRKRVLFLSDHLGHAGGVIHGATRYFLTVLPRIDRNLFEVTVCFLQAEHPAADQLRRQGVDPIFLNRRKWDVRALGDIKRLIREREIELVHCAGMKGVLLGRIAAHVTGAAAIIHLHDMQPPGMMLRSLQRRVAGWTDRAIVVSNAVAQFAIDTFHISPDRVEVLHNGIEVNVFAQAGAEARASIRREFGYTDDDAVIGIIGRILTVKDHPTLLRALVEVRRRIKDAKVLVVGDGPDRARCENLTSELGVRDAVCFAGQRQDIERVLAGMDVMAMPSLHEGYPYAMLEALAAGKPVVATNVGGLPEIITHGCNGLLVPPSDPTSLARALVTVLSDPVMRRSLSDEARRGGTHYDVATHVRRLEQLYLGTLAGRDAHAASGAVPILPCSGGTDMPKTY